MNYTQLISRSALAASIALAFWLQVPCPQQATARQIAGVQKQHDKPADIPSAWKGLIGEYVLNKDTLSVSEQDGVLRCTRTSGWTAQLRAEGKDRYEASPAWPDGKKICMFRRNPAGFAESLEFPPTVFKRLFYGGESGSSFRIKPLRLVAELRAEARRASPPVEKGNFRKADLVEVKLLDSTLHLDIRYASPNNFMGEKFYSQARAFLQRPAAAALLRAQRSLRALGYGLLIHDAYRPWYVTKMFWDATPKEQKDFVADPAKGSRHNRGCAVDCSLYDLRTGAAVEMVSGYDEFSHRAYPDYPGGTSLQRWHRQLLRQAMEAEGFKVFEVEWWHFDYMEWRSYPIGTLTFEEIR
jgi:D-alanyl-D-alanine dipeptidase